ncbi:hypothetical protein FQB35_10925 [Crassaminicella thermophila]|uniref:Uncharacterized protein n=1 Tax=Crassaminicella thermophila TaxID=2599308 RepID=A0A5C0SGB3_CRATE|nr:hypothetical protein [Crassaminicella thermophila]QEK12796.1 hypothetical protein FQB35_10925 [Crassaminicella thermophila]
MNEVKDQECYKCVIDMINTMGIDSTDDYLKQELRDITKDVACIRERITDMKNSIFGETNSDELNHLKYDIEDAQKLLNNVLKKLEIADKRYIFFKEYTRNKINSCY